MTITQFLEDHGGSEAIPAALRMLIDAIVGTQVTLASMDRYLFELAANGGLVNRRSRKAFAIVADRMRVADSLTRQLQALGLCARPQDVPNLHELLAEPAAPAGEGGP